MTHTSTEQERALADLRHMYAQMVGGMVKDSAQAKRIADGILSRAIQKLEQAARRAPAVPVPRSEPVAYLWQHCETGRTRVVMPDMVITADANWIVVGPLYLAAAPQPAVPQVTQEMVAAAEDAYMPFGDMELAIQCALSAANKPPEAEECPSCRTGSPYSCTCTFKTHRNSAHSNFAAAPVKLPEPFAYVEHHKAGDNLWFDHPGGKHSALYTEQQVRDLLAAHGIKEQST